MKTKTIKVVSNEQGDLFLAQDTEMFKVTDGYFLTQDPFNALTFSDRATVKSIESLLESIYKIVPSFKKVQFRLANLEVAYMIQNGPLLD